jgi:beta-phosphoglucomutase family hydrolase
MQTIFYRKLHPKQALQKLIGNILMEYRAFLFDLNGTMIDDMPYHVRAWHRILNELGASISPERMKEECYGKNQELIERILPNRFSSPEKDAISIEKEMQYQREFRPHLALLPGLHSLLQAGHEKGVAMAIGSAAIMSNIDFVVDGLGIRHYFDAIVSADDVAHSKPDPETYLKCAERLQLPAKDCLVFEDAPKGVESARNAGMKCVVITTMHAPHEFERYDNVVAVIKDYHKFELP